MLRPSYIKRGSTRQSDDTLDDDLSISCDGRDDTKRKSRNLSEKKRRDLFNSLINELNIMVSTDTRKMDKSTVLKSTISFLRNHNVNSVKSLAYEIGVDWKPSFLTNEQFSHLILDAIDGFILVFTMSGQILYASENITSLLGHLPRDLASVTMYELVHENDHSQLYNLMMNTGCLTNQADSNEAQVLLSCHVRRGALDTSQAASYELVQFQGYVRESQGCDSSDNASIGDSFYFNDTETKLMFVGTGKLQVPLLMPDISTVDASKIEFTSRHSLEWKFLFLDHRASPIIGYLPFEVLGTSGYDYYHVDDLDKVVACHEALMNKGEGTSCHYRFLMKGQQWIWLQTRFYITYHQWNSKPEFIVCTHRVLSYVDMFRHNRRQSDQCDEDEAEEEVNEEEELEETNKTEPRAGIWSNNSCIVTNSRSDTVSMDSKKFRLTTFSSDNCSRDYSLLHKMSPLPQPPQTPSPTFHSPAVEHSSFAEPHHYVTVAPVLAPSLVITNRQQHIQSPVLAPSMMMSGSPCHMQPPLLATPLVLTNSQVHLQEQLQQKHQQLQALIQVQQEELRHVSEQLLMAQFSVANSAPSPLHSLPQPQVSEYNPEVLLAKPTDTGASPQHQLNLHGQSLNEGTPYQLSQQQAQLLFPSLTLKGTQHS